MGTTYLNTGTAADLLTFENNWDPTDVNRLSRVATANQEWIVKDWDGEMYYIKFNKNFSKKHLFTFSKKTHKVQREAYLLDSAGHSNAWEKAEHEMLHRKIDKVLHNRNSISTCTCTHPHHRHQHGGGACRVVGCACTGFKTTYAVGREALHKPETNHLAGAPTSRNTCIAMNYVPKAEFESVVVRSLQAVEKSDGLQKGHALAKNVGDEELLRRDFGLNRKGVISQTALHETHDNWQKLQGCYVLAKKQRRKLENKPGKFVIWKPEIPTGLFKTGSEIFSLMLF